MVAVTVVDFGAGNMSSVLRALTYCDADVTVGDRPEAIRAAERLVLPGVGAFGACVSELRTRGLAEPLLEFTETGRPFLGICVGMQMMFDSSEEFGLHEGLGLLSGSVRRIPDTAQSGARLKVPHIGWNALKETRSGAWCAGALHHVPPDTAMYFVHSYQAEPTSPEHLLAKCVYGGWNITAAVGRDNLFGCQFHPEKSGEAGLDLLRSFLAL